MAMTTAEQTRLCLSFDLWHKRYDGTYSCAGYKIEKMKRDWLLYGPDGGRGFYIGSFRTLQLAKQAATSHAEREQANATVTTMRQLEVDQWFSFTPDSDGTWSECYKYAGNGWYGRDYSGGPWHKPNDTHVYVLSDELQAICNKQEQALIAEYLRPVVAS